MQRATSKDRGGAAPDSRIALKNSHIGNLDTCDTQASVDRVRLNQYADTRAMLYLETTQGSSLRGLHA
eukprot:9280877-Pyramimonas_sp.AAC.1